MKTLKSSLLLLIALIIGVSLVIGGCSSNTAKKPATDNTTTTPTKTTTTVAYPTAVANQAAAEASKVSGVNKATAIVSGKMIYIGLDLDANLGSQTSTQVEKNVTDKVKNVLSSYSIMVSSDADTVTRIKKVGQGISQGKPLSSFTQEIKDIDTRITPTTK